MITAIELEEAKYNARDVLGMCRVMPHLVDELERTNTSVVYEYDELMADLALQMTRVGMPVNSERRAEIGARLVALRDAAIEAMRPFTEGDYRESFLDWVASFFAVKARNGEPVAGSTRVGPTRALAEHEEARAALAEWKAYRKQLTPGDGGEAYSEAYADAEQQIASFTEQVKQTKMALAVAQFVADDEDGLAHTTETAYAVRHAIRKAQAIMAIEKKGVNFGAKVQQCAILRAAGVPIHKKTEKSGLPKIDKEVLEGLARHLAAKALLSFTLTSKTINVYIEGEKRAGKGGGKSRPVMVTEDGYIHCLWTIHKITGRWGSSPNCFDGETEYLTNRGWIRADVFEKLSHRESLTVAQFDKDSHEITFVAPTAVIEKTFTGDMVRLQRRNIDLLVTPEHRLLLGRRDGTWSDSAACDLVDDRMMWLAGDCHDFGIIEHTQSWIAFLCAAQADGNWNGSGWKFGFTRERKIQRMRWLLRDLGLEWTEDTNWFDNPFKPGEQRQRTHFYVLKSDLGDEVHAWLGNEKAFGSRLLTLSRKAIETLLREIMLWDGSYTRRNCYSSSQKANVDWVQLLFVLTGRRAYLRDYNGSLTQKKINWQVDVCEKAHTWTTNTEKSTVPWDGKVYCISVPSSYIVIRRNGKVMVVGQCQNWSKRAGGGAENLRAMIEAPEGYTLIGADQCLASGTLIDTPHGHIPIEQMKAGMLVFTYSGDRPSCSRVLRTKFSGTQPTMLVTLDNGEKVRCTFDHPWMLHNGQVCVARKLRIGARLLPLRRTTNGVGYEVLYSRSSFEYAYTHKEIARTHLGEAPTDHFVHHLDHNSRNNDPANLSYVSKHDHRKLHREDTVAQWQRLGMRSKMAKGIREALEARGGHVGAHNPNFGNKRGMERVCPMCQVTFYTQRAKNKLFCTKLCYNAFRMRNPRKRGKPYVPQNHSIAAIDYDGLLVPVYDIEVERDHNFALSAGVFVHNCQIEARLIGAMSQCKYMIDTFKRRDDIHSAFALIGFPDVWPRLAAVFKDHKAAGKCTCVDCNMRNQMRDVTKRLEYGAFYGGKEQTLFESIAKDFPESTLGQVREFLRRFDEMLPEVLLWRKAVLDEAIRQEEIRSPILGRRQVFPLGRVDPNVAYNYKAQSGAADIWAIGAAKFMQKWNQEEYDVRLINNSHDSVLILVRNELAEQVEQDVYACWNMEWNGVPFEMESKIATQWSET
jgi:hypothetical protein